MLHEKYLRMDTTINPPVKKFDSQMLSIQIQLSWYYLSTTLKDLSSLKLFPTLNHNILKKTYPQTSRSWRYLIPELKALPVMPAVISSPDIQHLSWYHF